MKIRKKPSNELKELILKSASTNQVLANQALDELALAMMGPIREAVLSGDFDLPFTKEEVEGGTTHMIPTDVIAPGDEGEFTAWTATSVGDVPTRQVGGDFVMIPTFEIKNAVSWPLRLVRNNNFDVVRRCQEIFVAGIQKKIMDLGFQTLIASAADRQVIVYDSAASAGYFSRRLLNILKTFVRRNGGGNSTSLNVKTLDTLCVSPECVQDIYSWGTTEVDDDTRREFYISAGQDGQLKIHNVTIKEMVEFGEGQEYQKYAEDVWSVDVTGHSDKELVLGLDTSRDDVFVMPVSQELETFNDHVLHRNGLGGIYGGMELGFAALDNRHVVFGSV